MRPLLLSLLTIAIASAQVVTPNVPYTGATQDIDIGAHKLKTTDISTPAVPSAGTTWSYSKAGKWCSLTPAGVENCTGAAGGTADPTFTGTTTLTPGASVMPLVITNTEPSFGSYALYAGASANTGSAQDNQLFRVGFNPGQQLVPAGRQWALGFESNYAPVSQATSSMEFYLDCFDATGEDGCGAAGNARPLFISATRGIGVRWYADAKTFTFRDENGDTLLGMDSSGIDVGAPMDGQFTGEFTSGTASVSTDTIASTTFTGPGGVTANFAVTPHAVVWDSDDDTGHVDIANYQYRAALGQTLGKVAMWKTGAGARLVTFDLTGRGYFAGGLAMGDYSAEHGILTTGTLGANRTFTFPDASGTVILDSTLTSYPGILPAQMQVVNLNRVVSITAGNTIEIGNINSSGTGAANVELNIVINYCMAKSYAVVGRYGFHSGGGWFEIPALRTTTPNASCTNLDFAVDIQNSGEVQYLRIRSLGGDCDNSCTAIVTVKSYGGAWFTATTATASGASVVGLWDDAITTTGAATGKKVLCIDPATNRVYVSSTGVDCSN